MTMNRYVFLIILPMAFFLSSCSDDDIEQPKMAATMFQGLWYCPESATFLEMSYSSFAGETYTDMDSFPSEAESFHGKWIFAPTNRQLIMTFSYHVSKLRSVRAYRVLGVDDLSMSLLDIELNAEYTYYKVVQSYNLSLGKSQEISIPEYPDASFSSSSGLIAEISDRGRVKARGSGTAFVKAVTGVSTVYVRIDVSPRPLCYADEMKGCTIDDILEKYGTPTFQGASDTPTMVVTYRDEKINDTSLEYIHYKYDEETREITQITTLYKNLDSFYADKLYIESNYYEIETGTYGEKEWLLNNSYFIMPLYHSQSDGEFYHIDYINIDYRLTHGYY